jgi:hypothetical protein
MAVGARQTNLDDGLTRAQPLMKLGAALHSHSGMASDRYRSLDATLRAKLKRLACCVVGVAVDSINFFCELVKFD